MYIIALLWRVYVESLIKNSEAEERQMKTLLMPYRSVLFRLCRSLFALPARVIFGCFAIYSILKSYKHLASLTAVFMVCYKDIFPFFICVVCQDFGKVFLRFACYCPAALLKAVAFGRVY